MVAAAGSPEKNFFGHKLPKDNKKTIFNRTKNI
jgi:hypothetical protein